MAATTLQTIYAQNKVDRELIPVRELQGIECVAESALAEIRAGNTARAEYVLSEIVPMLLRDIRLSRDRRRTYALEMGDPMPDPDPRQLIYAPHDPVVYFISFAGAIKVGFTTGLRERMTALTPDEVLLLMWGGREEEQRFHKMLTKYRRTPRGEWFHDCPEIRAWIDALQRGTPDRPRVEQYI